MPGSRHRFPRPPALPAGALFSGQHRRRRRAVLLLLATALPALASAGFLATLPPAEAAKLGLAHLTPAEAAAVDAAVDAYAKTQATAAAQKAATAAVVEYQSHRQPAVVAQAVSAAQQRADEDRVEKFSTKIIGRFSGWGGATRFALDNGQVWQQAGSEIYYTNPIESPTVEVRKATSGHFRLYLPDGTWVTVKRVR